MSGPSTRSYRCTPSRFQSALDEARRAGAKVTGSPSEGSLAMETPLGPFEGSYTYDGEILTLTVLRRPMLVPLAMLWDRLDALCGPPVSAA